MKYTETNLSGKRWELQGVYADDKGRLVGFGIISQCCEDYDSYIWPDSIDFTTAVFDEPFVETSPPEEAISSRWGNRDPDLSCVAFPVVDGNGAKGFLILGNSHNGYYSHEYVVRDGDNENNGYL